MTTAPSAAPAALAPDRADLATIRRRLDAAGQSHLLRFYDELTPDAQLALLAQIAELDIERIPSLVEAYVHHRPETTLPPDVQPAPYYPADPGARPWDPDHSRRIGQELIRAGKVAAFVVAGGQGSRLGYEGPKGCYPAGAVTGKPLFEIFAEALLGAHDRYGVRVPWFIMTSPLNHAQTVDFFRANRFFGLEPDSVAFFQQGVMPSFDIDSGRVLLAEKGAVATNPDGHGGSLKALFVSGALERMRREGVEHISYFQVDNPVVNVLDPVFLGLHAQAPDSSAEMSSKMVAKRDAAEKVGVFCAAGSGPAAGRVQVIEYSDLPRELGEQRDAAGNLRFNAGSIAIHAMSTDFVRRLNTEERLALPYHRAEKKVPCVDTETGEPVRPQTNNAVKLERFVFDALPLCRHSIVLETRRVEEFAPIKNATGEDSPESSRRIQTERAARWLEACGVAVPRTADGAPDCTLEISPRTATSAEELRAAKLPRAIERGAKVAF